MLWLACQQVSHSAGQLPSEPLGRPNVLLILADDLGVEHLDWHPVGVAAANPVPTPVLSALAAQGIVFTDAYGAPICGPSRACLLTGRLPFRHGLGANPNTSEPQLSLSELTLAEALRGVGYQTGAFGKWHVSLDRDDPNLQGFRHFDGTVAGLKGASYYDWPRVVNGVGFNETGYNTSVITDSAIAWIEAQGKLDWFAYVAYSAPHTPFEAPPAALDPLTQAKPGDPDEVIYAGMIEALDTEIGRLLSTVDLETTLVLFFGDNGTAKQMAQAPLLPSKAKYTVYEGGVRVPALVIGATVNGSGEERPGLIHLVDVFRTVLDAAGAPKTPGPIDSVSLLGPYLPPAMRWQPRRKYLYTERFEPNGAPPNGAFTELRRAVRDGHYKLIRTETGDEFYDLWSDPWEVVDLLQGPLLPAEQAALTALDAKLNALVNG